MAEPRSRTVTLAELDRAGRWDAEFHVSRHELADDLDAAGFVGLAAMLRVMGAPDERTMGELRRMVGQVAWAAGAANCPACSAERGQECLGPSGQPQEPHRERIRNLRALADQAAARTRAREPQDG